MPKLKLIRGNDEGTGSPIGQLVDATKLDPYDLRLRQMFSRFLIYVRTETYIGGPDKLILAISLEVSADAWRIEARTPKRRHAYLGQLSLDIGNYLGRRYNTSVYCPTIDWKRRASKGIKNIKFEFEISRDQAAALGIDLSEMWPGGVIQNNL